MVSTTGPPESVRVVTALPASGAGGAASLYAFPRVEGSGALAAAARSQHTSLLTRRDVLGGVSIAPLTSAGKQVNSKIRLFDVPVRCLLGFTNGTAHRPACVGLCCAASCVQPRSGHPQPCPGPNCLL